MKMSEEEIKKYTEVITKNSDNLFVCPRPYGPWQAPKGGLGHNSPPTLHGTTVQPLKVTGVVCSNFSSWDARSLYTAYISKQNKKVDRIQQSKDERPMNSPNVTPPTTSISTKAQNFHITITITPRVSGCFCSIFSRPNAGSLLTSYHHHISNHVPTYYSHTTIVDTQLIHINIHTTIPTTSPMRPH